MSYPQPKRGDAVRYVGRRRDLINGIVGKVVYVGSTGPGMVPGHGDVLVAYCNGPPGTMDGRRQYFADELEIIEGTP